MIFSFKRFVSRFVLFSFFFQTLWPSVVFARLEIPLGQAWRDDLCGLTYRVQHFKEEKTLRDLVRIEAFIRPEEKTSTEEGSDKPVAVAPSQAAKASPAAIVTDIPEVAKPKTSPVLSNLSSGPSQEAEIKKLLDQIVDVKTFTILDGGFSLYKGLALQEKGIGWAFGGLAFILDRQWNVITTGQSNFEMALKVYAKGKGNVTFDNVSAKQILAQGQDVLVRGTGNIDRLDAWATGDGKKLGVVRVTEDSSEEMTQLLIHQGKGENLGELKIKEFLRQTEEFANISRLLLDKGAVVQGGRTFLNSGTVEGESYTLQSDIIRNLDKGGKKATIKATEGLTFEAKKLDQQGEIAASSTVTLTVDQLEDSKTSTIKAKAVKTKLSQSWIHQGEIHTEEWNDQSSEAVLIANQGQITSTKKTTLSAQFRNGQGGKSDLSGVTFKTSRYRQQPLVNEGEMVLRQVQSLGDLYRDIENRAGAKLLFLDHGYRPGRNEKSVSSTNSLQMDKQAIAAGVGLHLGKVTNAGTIGFGEGSYILHGVFLNQAGGVQEVLQGQDLWQEDFVNHGEVKALHGYRVDQSQGIFTKLGKLTVKGQTVTKLSAAALRHKTKGTVWHHTGHLDTDEWIDESEDNVTLENRGTMMSRRKTTLAAKFENALGGTADLTGVSFNNSRERWGVLNNRGTLTLRKIRSLGQDRRDLWNGPEAKLTLLDCGYSSKEWDSTTGGFTLGKIDNYGTIGFGQGNFYTKVFTNHNVEEVLPGYHVQSDDFINHGVIKVHTQHFLIDQTRGIFSKLGKLEAPKGSVRIEFSEETNAADYLAKLPLAEWKLMDQLTIWAPLFHNTQDLGIGCPLELLIASFQNDAKLHSYGLTLRARIFGQGTRGGKLGEIKSSGPLQIEIEGDVDNRRGKIESEDEGEVISEKGNILVGQGVGGPYRQKNGAYIYSARGLKMKSRNMKVSFGEVGSRGKLDLQFKDKLTLESATIKSRNKTIFQGKSAVITRTAPYQNGENICDTRFWHSQWRHRDGGDASQVLVGDDLQFFVDELSVYGSNVTAMGDITDKYGLKRTKDNLGYFIVQPIAYREYALKTDKYPNQVNQVYDWRQSTFNASGQIDLTFSHYQLASLIMMAAGIRLHGDYFSLGSSAPSGSSTLVPTTDSLSLLPALMSMVGGITKYNTPQQNPYVVYSTGSFTSNIIDPALLTLVRSSMEMASFLFDPMADVRHLRQITDEEGIIQAIQLLLTAALGKGYLFPKKGATDHLYLLLKNARQQAKGNQFITPQQVKQAKNPLLVGHQQTLNQEEILNLSLFIPGSYVKKYLLEPSRGTIAAEVDGISIDMSKFLGVKGGNMAADKKDIKITSKKSMTLEAIAERSSSGENYHEHKVGAYFYIPEGKLEAEAEKDLDRQAITVESKQGAKFKAKGKGVDAALAQNSHHKSGDTTTDRTTHAVSTYRFLDGILEEDFGGDLDTYAQDVEAAEALTTAARVREHAVHDTVHQTTNRSEGGGLFGGSHKIHEDYSSSTSRGSLFKLKKSRRITARLGHIVLEGVNYRVPQVILNAPKGAIQFLARRDTSQSSRTEESSSTIWMSKSVDKTLDVTHTPCEFSQDSVIKINSAEGAIVEGIQGKTLEWLKRLERNGGELTQRDLTDLHLSEHFEGEGPTAACGLVISLAVSLCTAGAGATLGAMVTGVSSASAATAAQAFVMGAVQASFMGVCSQAAVGLLSNNGEILQTAEQLIKKDSLKSIGISAVIAGATLGLGRALGTPGTNTAASLQAKRMAEEAAKTASLSAPTLAQKLEAGLRCHFQHQAVKTAVSMAVNMGVGKEPAEVLNFAARGLVAGLIGAMVANRLSEAADPHEKEPLNPVIHKLLHGALGAGTGAILGGDQGAKAGAISAFIAETVADLLKDDTAVMTQRVQEKAITQGISLDNQDRISELLLEEIRSTLDMARISGVIAALLTSQDVAVAETTATNAVENNFAMLMICGASAIALYHSASNVYKTYQAEGALAAVEQLGIEVAVYTVGGAALGGGGKVIYKIGSTVYPTLEAAVSAALTKTPGLKIALGGLVDKLIKAGDAIAQSAFGKALVKADDTLSKGYAKVSEKLGFGKAAEKAVKVNPLEKKLDFSRYSKRTNGDAAHHLKVQHGQLRLDKKDQGVFYGEPTHVTQESWNIAQQKNIQPINCGYEDVYIVPRPNAGYIGGPGGQRGNLDYVTIRVEAGTNKLITAYPSGRTIDFPDGHLLFSGMD